MRVTDRRDYRKFLDEDGKLAVKLLPRKVYTAIVNDYRRDASVIDEVFEELYFTWDLEQQLKDMKEQGLPADKAAAAQRVIDQMDDADWWRVMAAFERALIKDFRERAVRWAALLDPVYDDQEANGWRQLQP